MYSNHSLPPFKARPLPLFNCTSPTATTGPAVCTAADVIEQPVNLGTLTSRYVDAAVEFVGRAKEAKKPFFLYVPFSHVHHPNFASKRWCNTSKRGAVGDAVQEIDHAIGDLLLGVEAHGLDENTLWFFTSDNGAPLDNDILGNGPLRDGECDRPYQPLAHTRLPALHQRLTIPWDPPLRACWIPRVFVFAHREVHYV
jgi:hypothetical protein